METILFQHFFSIPSQFLSEYGHAFFISVRIIIFIYMNSLPFMPNDV